jgi:hypothetical protein
MDDTRSATRKRFDAAFAAARKRGDKTFDFDGKSIAVKLKDDSSGLNTPKLSNEGQTMPAKRPSMAAQGLTSKGEQMPLRSIPKLSNPDDGNDVPVEDTLSPGETLMKKGGRIKKYAKGGSVSSRADGIAKRGHTKGRIC